jgi:hypothetical protein
MTDFDPDEPLTTRGVRRTRFDPLRDAPKTAEERYEAKYGDSTPGEVDEYEDLVKMRDELPGSRISAAEALISAVRRHVASLGLSESVEGAAAVVAAEKAADASGSAAASCLHELRMAMKEISAMKPAKPAADPTEDVLGRRRERKAGA